MSRSAGSGGKPENDVDAQLAARLAKLTGMSDLSSASASRSGYVDGYDDRYRNESDLVDEILSQARDEAVLEHKHSVDSEQSLMNRLAKLKAPGAVPSSNSSATSVSTGSMAQDAPVISKKGEKVNPLDELEWLSSDDENDEEVLDRVVAMAMAYPDSEEER